MKTLKLQVDALRVESFQAEGPEAAEHPDTARQFSGLSVYRPCFNTEQPSCRC
jgi:hypothetical protein